MKIVLVSILVVALSGCNIAYKNTRGSEFTMGEPACGRFSVITLKGEEIDCLTEAAMIAYYTAQVNIQNRKNRLAAIEKAKGDAAAQVLLAFDMQKSDNVKLVKSKTWDERALPYASMLWRVLTGSGFGIGNSREANYLELKGDGNVVNIGNETDVGGDYNRTRSSSDYKYIMQSTQTQSGAGVIGELTSDHSEENVLFIPEEG